MSEDAAVALVFVAFVFGMILLFYIPWVFYLVTMHKALNRVAQERRKTTHTIIWLNLIPLVQFVTHFFMVSGIADSLADEYYARKLPLSDQRPGYTMGLVTSIMLVLSMVPWLGLIFSMVFLVTWIIYWVQIAEFSRAIANPPEPAAEPAGSTRDALPETPAE
jgi:hypothetical protein